MKRSFLGIDGKRITANVPDNKIREPDLIDDPGFKREMAANRFIKKHGLGALCGSRFDESIGEYVKGGI